MCGIVGLPNVDRDLEPDLGPLLTAMLVQMTERGPDSAGVAVLQNRSPSRLASGSDMGMPRVSTSMALPK